VLAVCPIYSVLAAHEIAGEVSNSGWTFRADRPVRSEFGQNRTLEG